MAEFPGKSFVTMEECRQCGIKPAVLLHYVLHKGHYLHICTACVLRLNQGCFCPICFTVYDDQYNLSNEHIKCSSCEAIYHLRCIPSFSDFFTILPATAASSSSSTISQNYRLVCPYCSDPNLKIFNFSRDVVTNAVKIDRNSSQKIMAAATISNRSMKKAAKIASVKAQIMCKEAAEARKEAKDALNEARKEAKDALNKLHDLTVAHQIEDDESDYESNQDGSGNDASDEESI